MILVFGKSGQVATELQNAAEVTALGRDQCDLSDPASCIEAIRRHAPSAVINAAAYTQVDAAEEHEALATRINGDAPRLMAETCAELDIPFVHISTDYVFSGDGDTPYLPTDETAPTGAYGRSKLQGELGVIQAGGRYVVLRTSWVFSAHGANFLKTMLRLGAERDTLNVVADQIGGPTPARDIANACLTIVKSLRHDPELAGTYHFSGTPDVSWADFARQIFATSGDTLTVNDIPSSAYSTAATRPLNSRMECSSLASFALARPDWQSAVHDIIQNSETSQ